MFKRNLLIVLYVFFEITISAQLTPNRIAVDVLEKYKFSEPLDPGQLLKPDRNTTLRNTRVEKEVRSAQFYNLQADELSVLHKTSNELLTFTLPVKEGLSFKMKMFKADVFAPGFQVYKASDRGNPYAYKKGIYYWGIINDDVNSIVALSVSHDELSGFIFYQGETYNLGKIQDPGTDSYILYKESDMKIGSTMDCGVNDTKHVINQRVEETTRASNPDNCVNIYVEVDYDIFVGKGGVQQAADYVSAVFSQVSVLYANEAINLGVSEILVWDIQDPYTGTSTSNYLDQFMANVGSNYNGDLAHLVGYQGGGGIAYVNVLCNKSFGFGYSDINSSYNNVPTYSWTIEVLTHEIGHNLGSRHTHDCVWNGNNTAIDGCGPAAGYGNSCGGGPLPDAGTIMSYCHLVGGVGIDFNLGFGPQPGDLIRNKVYNASCLTACADPLSNDAGITSIISPVGNICTSSVSPEVELQNFGTNNLTTVVIEYQLDGGTVNTYNWSGNLLSGTTTSVTLPAISFAAGGHTFTANTSNPNGVADENPGNDGNTSNFTRQNEQIYYADNDGDGYGDPNNTILDCQQPQGYVTNADDCDDTNGEIYPGGSCNDGQACTTGDTYDANCNCIGTYTDSDGDGVCDANDICPGGDDTIDSDGDGTPDFCDCNAAQGSFNTNPLTHSGGGSSSATFNFSAGDKDPSFTVSGLDAKTNGNPNSRYEEVVTITYVDGNGAGQTYGTFTGDIQPSVSVDITGEVQSVTVSLSDGTNGSKPLTVDLSGIGYCSAAPPCADADGDGVCDADDICPGGDDTVDSDGDGIPDFCDTGDCNTLTSQVSPNPLTHSGGGSSTSTVSFPPGNSDVTFSISGLGALTNGKPSNRYIEQVTVSYVDDSGATVQEGVYSGNIQSSANISISGEVQSVTVTLVDGYDGNAPGTLSVTMSDVSSCGTAAVSGTFVATTFEPRVYPNPANELIWIDLNAEVEEGNITIVDLMGRKLTELKIDRQTQLMIPVRSLGISSQLAIVIIEIPGKDPIIEKVMIVD